MTVTENLDQYIGRLVLLSRKRDAIEHEMGKLHLAIRGLTNLVDDKAEREAYRAAVSRYPVHLGITDLISACLNIADKALTPREIRDFIVNYGTEISTQQNLLQSVHTIIRRMEESGEAKAEINNDGDKAYRKASIAEVVTEKGIEPKSAEKVSKRLDKMMTLAELLKAPPLDNPFDGMSQMGTLDELLKAPIKGKQK